MSDEPTTTEVIEAPTLEAVEDLPQAEDAPEHRTILETWDEIFAGGEIVRAQRITPGRCAFITSRYPQVRIQEMPLFHEIYHNKIAELHAALKFVIEAHPKAIKQKTVEKDRENNHEVYLEAVILFQQAVLSWELLWTPADPEAHIELAAISEAHKFVFGSQEPGASSLLDHLNTINLVFTEDDQAALVAAINDLKGDHE